MVKKATEESKNKEKAATFEPIKMGLAVAAAAATVLVLFATVAVYM